MPKTPGTPTRLAVLAVATLAAAASLIAQGQDPRVLGFKKRFAVEITNPAPFALESHPIVLDIAKVRSSVAADFNPAYYALFEEKGGAFTLIVSQADDLDADRQADEVVLVRTLPASSTTTLLCYYSPDRSFQLMPTPKAFARLAWEPGGAEAGWESNLAAFKIVRGRVEPYAKLQAGLILKSFPAAEARPQDWGLALLGPGDSPGLGGLSFWDERGRAPFFGPGAPKAEVAVVAPGPVRAMVKVRYPEPKVTVLWSAFADNAYARADVLAQAKASGPIVCGPGIQKLVGETTAFEKDKGYLAVWGKGPGRAGEVGLAAIFDPTAFAGVDDSGADHAVKLNGDFGRALTAWVIGSWERGVTSPGVPASRNWARRVEDLARRLLVPVKVEFKAR